MVCILGVTCGSQSNSSRLQGAAYRPPQLEALGAQMSEQYLEEEFRKLVARKGALRRKHASSFLASREDKEREEKGVAEEFVKWLEQQGSAQIKSIRKGDDPPDIILETVDNKLLAVEVTELVNQEAIDSQLADDPSYLAKLLDWSAETTPFRIEKCLQRKQLAAQSISHLYHRYIVLLHTAELILVASELERHIKGHEWPQFQGIDAAYVLGSYEPGFGYPVTELFCT